MTQNATANTIESHSIPDQGCLSRRYRLALDRLATKPMNLAACLPKLEISCVRATLRDKLRGFPDRKLRRAKRPFQRSALRADWEARFLHQCEVRTCRIAPPDRPP